MIKEFVNGNRIPYDLSILELKELLSQNDMLSFTLGCEALSQKANIESFDILFSFLSHKDSYKRRYALEAICHHTIKDNLSNILTEKLFDSSIFVVKTALKMIYEKEIKVPKEKVFEVIIQKGFELDAYHFRSLSIISTDEDFNNCIAILKKFGPKKSIDTIITEILFNLANEDNWRTLYNLTEDNDKAQIRIVACKLLVKFDCLNELSKYKNDKDGHVRRFVKMHSPL